MSLQLNIEKLNGFNNYNSWSMTVRAYLESEDLWTVVESGPKNNEASMMKDKRAKFILLCLVNQGVSDFMVDFPTAGDLWPHVIVLPLNKLGRFVPVTIGVTTSLAIWLQL